MNVEFIGFGGGNIEYPCYQNEEGKIFFDLNDGKNGLYLCTGAYKEEFGEICGEPNYHISEHIYCANPFVRHPNEFDYMMLSRLKSDCDYFLGYGNANTKYLFSQNIDAHCNEMKRRWDMLDDKDKPEWLTLDDIYKYRKQMIEKAHQKGEKICLN